MNFVFVLQEKCLLLIFKYAAKYVQSFWDIFVVLVVQLFNIQHLCSVQR